MTTIAIAAACLCVGIFIGLLIGPASEGENAAFISGWVAGHDFAKQDGLKAKEQADG